MPKVVKPLDIHNLLPQTNCKLCGESSCIAFATKLANRQTSIEKCPHLFKPDFSDKLQKLMELLAPPVKEVIIGVSDRAVKIGGKEVVYRHELTWRNPTAIFIDIHDEMSDQDISARFNFVKNFKFVRMGVELSIDGLAIRCVSGNPERYAKLVSKAVEEVGKPIALCCLEKEPLEEALIIAGNVKPLIYAATKDNWRDLAELASKHKCPLAILSNGDMALLKSLVKSVTEYYKVSELVLDPGTFAEEDVNVTLNNFVAARLSAIDGGDKELGYPLLGVPAALWSLSSKNKDNVEFEESVLASLLMSRFADMLIMHTISPWAIIPVLTWRDCVYTDPRVPSSVKPGLYKVGSPNESSPLMVTANFTLTYYIVKDDIEKGGVDAWLLVIDTEGTSVQSAVAGGRFTADKVFESMKAEDAFSKVSHKSIILPGYAAKISGELESLLGDWKVYVGPRDSAEIPSFVKNVWLKDRAS